MVRRRKIPARKHHGIRDPLKQLEEKTKKLAGVINCPPGKGEAQKVSNKFSQFKKLADSVKRGKKIKKPQFGQEDLPKNSLKGTQGAGKKIKAIKQFLDETDEDYLKRVNRVTTQSLKEAQYEAKYGVEIVKNPKTGEISIKKKPPNEIDELLKKKLKVRKDSKNSSRAVSKDVTEKKQLVKQAIKELKEESKQNQQIKEYQHDDIRFGEIVHAPPSLTLPRKAQKTDLKPRPGQKDSLLLKNLINDNKIQSLNMNSEVKKAKTVVKTPLKADLKQKRKNLPVHTRTMLEAERSKVVEIYRQLKKSKLSSK